MKKKRLLAAKVTSEQHKHKITQLETDLQNTQVQFAKLLKEVSLANELDTLQHTVKADMTKLGPFANKIKKKWLKAVQQITGQPTRTITKADIGSEITIPAEERKWYSIQEEAPNRSLTDARYQVITQGLMVGHDVIEFAIVARTSDS
jgi:hypothetical protein